METEVLQTELGTFEIYRTSHRRRLTIVLHPWQGFQIRTSKKTTVKEISLFLLEKKTWIEKHLKSFEAYRLNYPKKDFTAGEKFPFLGRDRILKFEVSSLPRPTAQFRGEQLIVYMPSNSTPADWQNRFAPLFRDLYKKVSVVHLSQRVQELSYQMQLFPTDLKFNESKTLWGSCSRLGTVRLNWKVIVFSPDVIDYLIIHELAHLKFMNHSKDFWQLVEKFCPRYKELKKVLKREQAAARFLSKVPV